MVEVAVSEELVALVVVRVVEVDVQHLLAACLQTYSVVRPVVFAVELPEELVPVVLLPDSVYLFLAYMAALEVRTPIVQVLL